MQGYSRSYACWVLKIIDVVQISSHREASFLLMFVDIDHGRNFPAFLLTRLSKTSSINKEAGRHSVLWLEHGKRFTLVVHGMGDIGKMEHCLTTSGICDNVSPLISIERREAFYYLEI